MKIILFIIITLVQGLEAQTKFSGAVPLNVVEDAYSNDIKQVALDAKLSKIKLMDLAKIAVMANILRSGGIEMKKYNDRLDVLFFSSLRTIKRMKSATSKEKIEALKYVEKRVHLDGSVGLTLQEMLKELK